MIYIINNDQPDIAAEIERAVQSAGADDLIIVPTIPSYNRVLKMLLELKPDTLIHVRVAQAKYFPAIGIESYYGSDTDPVIDLMPPDDTKFV